MESIEISKAILERIPRYLSFLNGVEDDNISATTIAKNLGLGEVQVRKDLGMLCGKGKPKTGYNRRELIQSLESYLSCDAGNTIIIGAGKLGSALLDYNGFNEYGIQICAAFDSKLTCEKKTKSGKVVYPIKALPKYCKQNKIQIGVITVPAESAQKTLDLLYKNGIKNICSFAPIRLNVPEDVNIWYENLALSLAHLKSHIKN